MPSGHKNSNNCRAHGQPKVYFIVICLESECFYFYYCFFSLFFLCLKSKSVSLKWNQKLMFRSPVFPPLLLPLSNAIPHHQVIFFFDIFDNLFILLFVFYALFTFLFFARKTCDLNFELIRSIIYIFFSNLPLSSPSLSASPTHPWDCPVLVLFFSVFYLFISDWFSGIAGSCLHWLWLLH